MKGRVKRDAGLPQTVRVLLRAQWAALVVYTVLLLLPHGSVSPVVRDLLVGNLVYVLPALVMLARGWSVRSERAWSWSLAAAVLSFLAGNLVYFWVQRQAAPPFPSWADPGYLAVYPFAVMAVVLSMRARIGRLRGSVLLDGLVGGLAAATVAAVAVAPLTGAFDGGAAQWVVATAYPVGDALVIAMVMGVLAATGGRPGSFYPYLAVGLTIFAVADTVYGYRVAYDTYVLGTPLDAIWAIGVAVMAQGVWRPSSERATPSGVSLAALWLVGAAGLVGLGVLATASRHDQPLLVVALATATLLAVAGRTVLAFLRVRDMAVVRRQAMTDELTDVANRRALYQQVERALTDRAPDRVVGLALIDLDRFKEVNDSLGHQAGDRLLQIISCRLAAELRALDPRLLLARLGGDEFAVLVPDAGSTEEVTAIAQRLRQALHEPVRLDDMTVHVRASTGVAVAPQHAANRTDLMSCADMAMYAGKRAGTGVHLFQPALLTGNRERLQIAEDLHRAIRDGELRAHYQPKVDMTGTVRGVEALVRWEHPQRGMLPPDSFLPVAEDHQLMPALTRIMLDIAVGDCAAWRRRGIDLTVSVNLSAGDLLDAGLPSLVEATLAGHGVPAGALILEITETTIMSDPAQAQATLEGLRAQGVELAVDDYGTGHCSLAYLRRLPVQELKLDRSFVRDMATDPRDAAIVRSTVNLAHSLGLRMVAEGVEDADAARLLAAAGCDLAQGWHFARPMPASDLVDWLEQRDTLSVVGASSSAT